MFFRIIHLWFQGFLLFWEFIIYKLRIVSPARYGKWLAHRIERLGGIYVKIGQLLSVRPDIISFRLAAELYPLLQELKPVKFPVFEKRLQQYANAALKNNLQQVEPQPLGTGSIAQVHRATLKTGETVVIKLIKPGIKEYINIDLRLFRFFMKMGSFMPGIKKLPVNELANEIDTLMREQLNLLTEADSLQRFKKNFTGNTSVVIPELYAAYCCPELIVMEYLPLPAAPDYTKWPAEQRTAVAKKALHMLYQMMFSDGFTHCDLHPGNFYVTEDGRFILLDFGMTTAMDDEKRADYIRFFYYMSTNNGEQCAEIIEKTALAKLRSYKREKLFAEVKAFIAEYAKLPAEKFSVLAFTKALIQTEKRCGLKGATHFINNILAITFFESHLKKIDPGIDFQREAVKYVMAHVPAVTI